MNKICKTQPANLSESLNLNQSDIYYSKDYLSRVIPNNSTRSEQKIEQKQINQFQDSQLKILATDKQDLQLQISNKIKFLKNNLQDQHKKNLNQKVYSILYGTLPNQETKRSSQQSKKEIKQNDQQDTKAINQINQQTQQQIPDNVQVQKKKQVEQVQLPIIQTRSQLLMQKLLDKNRQKRSISHNVNDHNQNCENKQGKKFNTSFNQIQQQNQINLLPQKINNQIQDKCGHIVFNQKIQQSQNEYLNNMQQENFKYLSNKQDNNQSSIDHKDKFQELQQSSNELTFDQILSNQRNIKKYMSKKQSQQNTQIQAQKNQRNNENIFKIKSFTSGIDSFQLSKKQSKTPPKSQDVIYDQYEKNQQNDYSFNSKSEHNQSNTEKLLNEIRTQSPNLSSIIQIEFPEIKQKIINVNENRFRNTPLRNNTITKKINQQNKANHNNIQDDEEMGKQKMISPNEKSRVVSPFCVYPVLINEQNGGIGDSQDPSQNKSSSKSQSRIRIRGTEQIYLKDAFSPKQRSTPHSIRSKVLNSEFSRSPKSKNIQTAANIGNNNQNIKSEESPSNVINLQFENNISQSSIDSSEIYNFNGIKSRQIQQTKQDIKSVQQYDKNKYFSSNSERINSKNKNKLTVTKQNNINIFQSSQQNEDNQEKIQQQHNPLKKSQNQVIIYSSLRKSQSQQKVQQQQEDQQNSANNSENCIKKIKLFFKKSNQSQENNNALQEQQNEEKSKPVLDQTKKNQDILKQNLEPIKRKSEKQQMILKETPLISQTVLSDERQLDLLSIKSKTIPIIPSEINNKYKFDKKIDLPIKEIGFKKISNIEQLKQTSPSYQAFKNGQQDKKQATSIRIIPNQEEQPSQQSEIFQNLGKSTDQNLEKKPKKLHKKNKKLDNSQINQLNDFSNLDPWEIEQGQDNYLLSYYNQDFCNIQQ